MPPKKAAKGKGKGKGKAAVKAQPVEEVEVEQEDSQMEDAAQSITKPAATVAAASPPVPSPAAAPSPIVEDEPVAGPSTSKPGLTMQERTEKMNALRMKMVSNHPGSQPCRR